MLQSTTSPTDALREHVRGILSRIKPGETVSKLNLREKQLMVALDEAIDAVTALDEMLAAVPPEHFTFEQFKTWDAAKRRAETARALWTSINFGQEKN